MHVIEPLAQLYLNKRAVSYFTHMFLRNAHNNLESVQSRTQSPRSSRSRNEGLWHYPFVFPTNPGDPVFQDGGHANRNTHYILILGREYEEFFVVLLSFLHNAIYSINYIIFTQ